MGITKMMAIREVIIFSTFVAFVVSEEIQDDCILEGVCLEAGYHPWNLPYNNQTNYITPNIEIEEIYEIDDRKETIDFLVHITLSWDDPRIQWSQEVLDEFTALGYPP